MMVRTSLILKVFGIKNLQSNKHYYGVLGIRHLTEVLLVGRLLNDDWVLIRVLLLGLLSPLASLV